MNGYFILTDDFILNNEILVCHCTGGSRVVYTGWTNYSFCLPLFSALLSRDWEKAEAFLKKEKDANIAPINAKLQTTLHLAVGVRSEKGNKHFVEKLVASIENKHDLARKDCFGETALHYAARFGNLDAAEIIIKRNPRLPHISCMYDTYPIHYASSCGYVSVDVYAYFLLVTQDPAPYTNLSGVKLLYALVYSNLYGKKPPYISYFLWITFSLTVIIMCVFAKWGNGFGEWQTCR